MTALLAYASLAPRVHSSRDGAAGLQSLAWHIRPRHERPHCRCSTTRRAHGADALATGAMLAVTQVTALGDVRSVRIPDNAECWLVVNGLRSNARGAAALPSPRMRRCPNCGHRLRAKPRSVVSRNMASRSISLPPLATRHRPPSLPPPPPARPSLRPRRLRTRSLRHNGWTGGRGIRQLIYVMRRQELGGERF